MTVRKIKSIGDIPYPIDVGADALSPLLTAGAALGITGDTTDSAAWLQRVSTSDGPTTVKSIKGNTLVWNQLLSTWTGSASGIAFSGSDGKETASGTPNTTGNTRAVSAEVTIGHKYLVNASGATYGSGNTAVIHCYHNYLYINGGIVDTSSWAASDRIGVGISYTSGETVSLSFYPQLFDLTAMFGSGNEPSTVAEFEALYPLPNYPYDPGSLLPVNMTGIETENADGNPLQTRTILAGTLRSAGTVYDELTETERITRVGERAYQSGDESDPTVTTDGTTTHYPLTTPTVTSIDPPLNMTYRTEQGGTERIMVPTGENSAPPTIVAAQGYTAESLRDAALSAIAPVENGIASTNYGVGSYLVHSGQLCKVTTAIATGEAITIGTNVTATTVMAEVIALIAQ